MAPRPSRRSRRKQRIVSISLDPAEAKWLDALVDLLEEQSYPKAARSEVVRMALLALRDELRDRTPSEIVRYFVQRDAERLVATLVETALPGDVPATVMKAPSDGS